MEEGFLRLSRRFFSNELWNAAREFSECEAWLDILQSACYGASGEARKGRLIGVREVSYTRGQYPASVSFLKRRWGWSTEKRVRCFLDKLRRKGMITVDSSQGVSVITVSKYDEYNPPGPAKGQAEGRGAGQGYAADAQRVESFQGQGSGQAEGQAKGKDLPLTVNDLREFRASLMEEVRSALRDFAENPPEPLRKEGQARGNNKKKGEEYNRRLTSTPVENNILIPEKETSPDGEAKKGGLSMTSAPESGSVDYQALMDYYNATFSGKLPAIKTMTAARKRAAQARISEHGKEAVMRVFRNTLESPFLLGGNDRNWKCGFDWIFNPTNFVKILEGNYNGQRTDNNQTRRESRKILNDLAAQILAADAAKDGL